MKAICSIDLAYILTISPSLRASTRMHLESLRVFCDIVGQRSFSKAAEANDMSQSGASQIVHQLEEELGVQLIDRSRRPFVLTAEGEIFYGGCRRLVDDFLALREEVRALHSDLEGRVRVASIYSIGLSYLKQAVAEFERTYPKAEVRVQYEHPDRVYALVESGQADIGLVSYPHSSRHIVVQNWRTEPLVLACAPSHELAGRESIELTDLQGLKLVGFDQDLPIRQEIDRALEVAGVEANVIMELDNIDSIKSAVEVHGLASLLPAPTLVREIHSGTLKAVPLTRNPLNRALGLILRKGKQLSPASQRFQRMLLDSVHEGSTKETAVKKTAEPYSAAS